MRTNFIIAIFVLCARAFAAGSVSTSVSQVGASDTWVITYNWVADSANGTVPVVASANLSQQIQGYWPISVETSPGSPAPTSGYAVAVLDASGSDILVAQAASLSNSAGQSWLVSSTIPPLNGLLRLQVTGNSVSGAAGTVLVYLSKTRARFGLTVPPIPAPLAPTATSIATALFVSDSGGSANVYAGCPSTLTALQDGLIIELRVAHTNTGASTMNYCATGALGIVDSGGATLAANVLVAPPSAGYYLLRYSVSAANWQLFGNCPTVGAGLSVSGCQVTPDLAVLVSNSALQAGTPVTVTTTSSSPTTYTGTTSPVGTFAYAKDQALTWDVGATACTGSVPTTLNINTLGAIRVFEADGSTNPVANDCTANRIVRIAFDGTNFRIVGGGNFAGGATIPLVIGALKGDGAGNAAAVTGTGSNCVHADGTSAACATGTVTHTGALTVNQPMIGNGSADSTIATKSGNTTQFGTTVPMSQPIGKCLEWDASGNIATAVSNAACGSGGGAGYASQLLDFGATKTSATVMTIGTGCSSTVPCIIRNGTVLYVLTSSFTITLSGTSASPTVYIYLANGNTMTVGHNSAATLTCSAGCTVATGITSVPPDAVAPLWALTVTGNIWDTIVPGTMDLRAVYSNRVTLAGAGISSSLDPTTGNQTISTDPTITPRYFVGSGAPALSCTLGRDSYTDNTTSGHPEYYCQSTNVWAARGSGGAGTVIQNFPMAFYMGGGWYPGVQQSNNGNVLAVTPNVSGPASASYTVGAQLLYNTGNQFVMVTRKASSTWSAAAGTVDVNWTSITRDAPSAGTWNFSVYVGCAAVNGDFTYGSASTLAVTAPSVLGKFNTYKVTGVNLPGSCAADLPMQFWIIRGADTGGNTLANIALTSIEVVMRGN